MARGALSENERDCLQNGAKNQIDPMRDAEKANRDSKPSLRVRFLDEEGKTERTVSADEVDCTMTHVKNIHIVKNKCSSETSLLLRNPSLLKIRSSDLQIDNLNNNSQKENLNGRTLKIDDKEDKTETPTVYTKDYSQHFKKNCNVYSVDQAKRLTPEKKKSMPLTMPKLISHKTSENIQMKSILPEDVCFGEGLGRDFTARAIGKLSRGLGRLLRRTNSIRISEPDPVYKVAYLGNVLTGWAKGESCVEKPLSTLWRNYQQSTKPDVVMKLSVTNSGLKGFTKEHGLTEYWSHRITYCASPPHYPKLFCWVYRHEGKKLKHELRCHAVLCTKDNVSKKITEELQIKLKQALVEFKKDRISKQNARLSLANSVYDNPSMPRRKILLSVGSTNYRPPLERSKSAPKLVAIEELCSEEDEEEAEMSATQNIFSWTKPSFKEDSSHMFCKSTPSLDRRRIDLTRKISCPNAIMRCSLDCETQQSNEIIDILLKGSKDVNEVTSQTGNDKDESRLQQTSENPNTTYKRDVQLTPNNYLVTDSDDGSVSSGCETASTITSDVEPTSLPSHFPLEEIQEDISEQKNSNFQRTRSLHTGERDNGDAKPEEVNPNPIGDTKIFRRRSTYPPLGADSSILTDLEEKFESLLENLTDLDSLNTETRLVAGDNDSACSDESGYSEYLLENGKESIIGNTIMV